MKWHNRRKFRSVMAGCGAFLLICVLFVLMRPPDPVYRGKRLSEHLYSLTAPSFTLTSPHEYDLNIVRARAAVLELRTEALPLLRSWLRPEPEWRRRLRASAAALLIRNGVTWPAFMVDRQKAALIALSEIPDEAITLLPELIALVREVPPRMRSAAIDLLFDVIESAPPEKKDFVRSQLQPVSFQIFTSLQKFTTGTQWHRIAQLLPNYDRLSLEEKESVIQHFLYLEAAAAPNSLVRLFDPAGEIENIVRLSEGRSVRKLSAVVFFRTHPVYGERVVPLLEKELTSTNELLAAAARKTWKPTGT